MIRALLRSGSAVALAVVLSSSARAQASQPEEARIADILQSALVAHGAEVNRCFERALADSLDVAGKIELSVDVGAGGKVTKAEPALDEVKSPVLLACLEASAMSWTLMGIDPGSTVVVPLAFEGQAAQFTIKTLVGHEDGIRRDPIVEATSAPFAAHTADFEYVGEIGGEGDPEGHAQRRQAIVEDVQLFVCHIAP